MSAIEFGRFVLTIAILLVAVLGPFVQTLLTPTAVAKLFSFSPSTSTVMGSREVV
jgi:hypothetical protein